MAGQTGGKMGSDILYLVARSPLQYSLPTLSTGTDVIQDDYHTKETEALLLC